MGNHNSRNNTVRSAVKKPPSKSLVFWPLVIIILGRGKQHLKIACSLFCSRRKEAKSSFVELLIHTTSSAISRLFWRLSGFLLFPFLACFLASFLLSQSSSQIRERARNLSYLQKLDFWFYAIFSFSLSWQPSFFQSVSKKERKREREISIK